MLDKKGKLLLEWVPKITSPTTNNNKYAFDRPLRFGLSPEEVALVLTKIKYGQAVELNRQNRSTEYYDSSALPIVKVFRAAPMPDGSLQLSCDYEKEGRGGQPPLSEYESAGPLEINLMVGESLVLQSIMEYSIPRLTGWSTLLDHSIDQAFQGSAVSNPQNNTSGHKGGRRAEEYEKVPF